MGGDGGGLAGHRTGDSMTAIEFGVVVAVGVFVLVASVFIGVCAIYDWAKDKASDRTKPV
jgi:hypothetical protein